MAAPNDYEAFFKFSVDASDSAGNYTATLNGAAVISGNALVLDGNTAYASTTVPDSLFDINGSFTITAVINGDGLNVQSVNSAFLSTLYDYSPGLELFHDYDTDTLGFLLYDTNGKGIYDASYPHTDGVDIAVALTFANGTASIYYNGALHVTASQTYTGTTVNGHTLSIGVEDPLHGGFFKGSIRNVRVYARELSSTEINDIYMEDTGNIVIGASAVASVYASANAGNANAGVVSADVSVGASAHGKQQIPPMHASIDVNASVTPTITHGIVSLFTLVQEMQVAQRETMFACVHEIEQTKSPIIIERSMI